MRACAIDAARLWLTLLASQCSRPEQAAQLRKAEEEEELVGVTFRPEISHLAKRVYCVCALAGQASKKLRHAFV